MEGAEAYFVPHLKFSAESSHRFNKMLTHKLGFETLNFLKSSFYVFHF